MQNELYVEIAKLMQDGSKLTSLFFQLQVVRDKNHPLQ